MPLFYVVNFFRQIFFLLAKISMFMPKIGLDTKFLISIGMDGPSVNRLFHTELQSDLATNNDGKTLIDVGTCSLHTANNSFSKVLD